MNNLLDSGYYLCLRRLRSFNKFFARSAIGFPSEYGPAGRGHLIHTAGAGAVRRRAYPFGVRLGFAGNRDHGVGEEVQFAFALGFGRLDHQGTMNDEREAYGVGMEAVIDEALRDITGSDTELRLPVITKDDLVHIGSGVG